MVAMAEVKRKRQVVSAANGKKQKRLKTSSGVTEEKVPKNHQFKKSGKNAETKTVLSKVSTKKILSEAQRNNSSAKKNVKKTSPSKEGLQKSSVKKPTDATDRKAQEIARKERKLKRKSQNPKYELAKKVKMIWEELRRRDTTKPRRKELSVQLYNMVEGQVKKLIYAHDTSRVIQCLMRYGQTEHKDSIFLEVQDDLLALCKSTYGKFLVRKFLKWGHKDQRQAVFNALYGQVRRSIKHKEAATLIELAYNHYANAKQRCALLEEFYGPSFAHFKSTTEQTLADILAANPEKKETIMGNMKEVLQAVCDKSLLQMTIVHKAFLEYFTHCTEKARDEMIVVVLDSLVHMLHTRDGARVTMMCIWNTTAKQRKQLMKTFKPFVLKIAQEEYGHLTLLALMDSVDDTTLLCKIILEPILMSLDTLAPDQYGRKVLLYILSPRDSRHFISPIVSLLQQGDTNPHSKKDRDVRRRELLDYCSPRLLQFVVDNVSKMWTNGSQGILVLDILTKITCDPQRGFSAIVEGIATVPYSPHLEHIIERPEGHFLLKHLIKNDKLRIEKGGQVLFSEVVMLCVVTGLEKWILCNRGCFLILAMYELEDPDVTRELNKLVKNDRVIEILKAFKGWKGAQLLLKRLQ